MRNAKIVLAVVGLGALAGACTTEQYPSTYTYASSRPYYSSPYGTSYTTPQYATTTYVTPSYTAPQYANQYQSPQSRYWNSSTRDYDRDGIPNRYDRDANGDGIPDRYQGR